ncbi:hypothetical protein ABZ930_36525 [Streptomyces sp. NPDC046716]
MSARYLTVVAAGVGVCVMLPYTEEMIRCLRARRNLDAQEDDR